MKAGGRPARLGRIRRRPLAEQVQQLDRHGEMNPQTDAWRSLTANMSMYTPFGVGGPFRFAEREDRSGASYAFVPSVDGPCIAPSAP